MGLSISLLFGKGAGTIATIVGLFTGPILLMKWPHIKEKLNPSICLECGSNESESGNKELSSRVISKPLYQTDLVYYNKNPFYKIERFRMLQEKDIMILRTIYQDYRKCKKCGHIHSIREYTVDKNITFKNAQNPI